MKISTQRQVDIKSPVLMFPIISVDSSWTSHRPRLLFSAFLLNIFYKCLFHADLRDNSRKNIWMQLSRVIVITWQFHSCFSVLENQSPWRIVALVIKIGDSICLYVCLFVSPHSKRKTTVAIDTKLGRSIVHDRKSECTDHEVIKSKVNVNVKRFFHRLHWLYGMPVWDYHVDSTACSSVTLRCLATRQNLKRIPDILAVPWARFISAF